MQGDTNNEIETNLQRMQLIPHSCSNDHRQSTQLETSSTPNAICNPPTKQRSNKSTS